MTRCNEPGLILVHDFEPDGFGGALVRRSRTVDVWFCFGCGEAVPLPYVAEVCKSNGESLGRIFPIKGCQDCVETAEALQRLREAVEAARDA